MKPKSTQQMIRTPAQLGAAVQRQRKALGLSQRALAASVGTIQPTISALENGSRGVSTELVFKVLAVLELDLFAVERRNEASTSIEALF